MVAMTSEQISLRFPQHFLQAGSSPWLPGLIATSEVMLVLANPSAESVLLCWYALSKLYLPTSTMSIRVNVKRLTYPT